MHKQILLLSIDTKTIYSILEKFYEIGLIFTADVGRWLTYG